jgi:exodeoxyribonuclease VII small subunit
MSETFIGKEDAADEAPKDGPPIASMSFEQALAELEGIVQRLERGQLDLEASIGAYERGTLLRQHCAEKLRQAQMRVDKLTFDADGKPRTTPLDPPE